MIPDIYQQVLYIRSTGYQWIDTALVSDLPDPFYQLQVKFLNRSGNWVQYFAGPKIPADARTPPKFFQWQNGSGVNGSIKTAFEGFDNGNAKQVFIDINHVVTIQYSARLLKNSGEIITENMHYPTKGPITWGSVSYYLFNGHEENKLIVSGMELYSLRMGSGNLLQREFIPCFIKATGEIGLYESVENKFYKNLGTRPFEKGPNVIIPEGIITDNPCPRDLRRRLLAET